MNSTENELRVLLAVDDSDTSLRAARTAHQLFGDHAKYWVMNVGARDVEVWGSEPLAWGATYPLVLAQPGAIGAPFHPEDTAATDVPSSIDRAEAEARAVSTAAGLPFDAEAVGMTGDPADQICHVADEKSIDVIVVGSQAGSWWRRLFEPSVTKTVVREADRPVLVVP